MNMLDTLNKIVEIANSDNCSPDAALAAISNLGRSVIEQVPIPIEYDPSKRGMITGTGTISGKGNISTTHTTQWVVLDCRPEAERLSVVDQITERVICRIENYVSGRPIGVIDEVNSDLIAHAPDYQDALLKLACLGNGERYGNSEGNCIAIRALGLDPAVVYNQKP